MPCKSFLFILCLFSCNKSDITFYQGYKPRKLSQVYRVFLKDNCVSEVHDMDTTQEFSVYDSSVRKDR